MSTQHVLSSLRKNTRSIAIGILIFLIIGAIVYFVPFPDGTVGVPFRNYSLNMMLSASGASTQNATLGTVQAQTLTYNTSVSDKWQLTDIASVGNTYATGSVIFTNKSSQQVEIPTGMQLSTSSGVTFITTLDVKLPSANSGSSYTPPVTIRAQKPGIIGNVPANTIVNITAAGEQLLMQFNQGLTSPIILTVTNPQPIIGGIGNATTLPANNVSVGNFLGLPYWLLAIVGLLLLIILLVLISSVVAWSRKALKQIKNEQEAVSRTEEREARRKRMEAVAAASQMAELQQQQMAAYPIQNKTSPEKNTIAISPVSYHEPEIYCPSCHKLIRANARFCTSCRFPLKPEQEDRVVKMAPSPVPEKSEQEIDNVLSVEKELGNDEPGNVGEILVQGAMSGHEKENSRVGQQFGNYKLLRYLGEGGFAEVYLGEHIHLGSYAAIKILSGRLTGGEQERFRLEARTLVRLVHPHIVRLLEFGIEDKVPFLVMDYAVNGTLRQRHHKGSRVPLPLVVNYVKQAADALQFAHDQKFIHRDIKPENMLVGSRNEILLSDFGIAIVAQSSRYQNPQNMAGTVSYMAPEQIQLHPRPASDQYSLGIVTYEWLCGSRPFQGSFTEIAVKHATIPPAPLRQKASTIPLSVEQVVMKSLAKDPKERFENVQAFAMALEQASSLH